MMSTLRREDPLAREKVLKNVSKTRLVFTNANALASMVPWVPETFLARFSGFFSRLRPSANNESSRRTRQKPLVPRVLVRELLAPVKGFPDAALLGSRASTWFRPLGVSCCAMKKIFEAFFSSCFSTSDKFVTTANFF